MKTEILTYQNGKGKYEIKISEADGVIGVYHDMLISDTSKEETLKFEALAEKEKQPNQLVLARRILHTFTYPACIAASEPVKGFKEWPISFDDFAHLPEPLIIAWSQKVFEINSHWVPKEPEPTEQQEKKVLNS